MMLRGLALVSCLCALGACGGDPVLSDRPEPIGEFALGYSVVVAPHPVVAPLSRKATDVEWIAAVKAAVDRRFARYEGEKLYHIAVSVDGYMLAQPGIPVLLSPKSALILNVTIWDDVVGKKLNPTPYQITVVESFNAKTLFGSGLTMTREAQLENLANNAARSIERWLSSRQIESGWFERRERAPLL
ncbi:MAG: hypothetical protein P8M25_05505 [Paracoccaceae bacterium]|nr:hypothetical protein [Paracoccaceae bacterium]